jgi:hypothetical protein
MNTVEGQRKRSHRDLSESQSGLSERKEKTRPNFSKDTTQVLMNWLTDHMHHPWPTKQEKKELCRLSGLNPKQLRIWFTNNRKVSYFCL